MLPRLRLPEVGCLPHVLRGIAVRGEPNAPGPFPLDVRDELLELDGSADALLEWQKDYEAAVRAKTGQTLPVPLLVSQHSAWNDIATSESPWRSA